MTKSPWHLKYIARRRRVCFVRLLLPVTGGTIGRGLRAEYTHIRGASIKTRTVLVKLVNLYKFICDSGQRLPRHFLEVRIGICFGRAVFKPKSPVGLRSIQILQIQYQQPVLSAGSSLPGMSYQALPRNTGPLDLHIARLRRTEYGRRTP